eukprot:CAMPEP_0170475002 /NCGR_PEP_ID=MMETSP0123-20130129/16744_1 /TAXON_ID=182087 /ORGANISM="Favella ehrenbergii, Strain Fehren 1" /LENGTH=41 /DNA_ID= /DNA_START= /DNA_END= /DNA_ORIENTATION=
MEQGGHHEDEGGSHKGPIGEELDQSVRPKLDTNESHIKSQQ